MMTNISEKVRETKTLKLGKDESYDNFISETKVTLYLEEDLGEFLEEKKINNLIKKYSEFV
jgi:HSP90 family molecular chaperone